jgi:AraC family transcriptional regulator, regulatory protein of adaptative response / methylated-DNA-[protein]-cysteine methyltransferase
MPLAPTYLATAAYALGECSLGSLLVATSEKGVCSILLGDNHEDLVRSLRRRFPDATMLEGSPELNQLMGKVVAAVEHPGLEIDLPLDPQGTAFQRRVWQALRTIPAGTTASYTDVAVMIGAPDSARAVAQACASNMLAVVVPCHRVVNQKGELSGYRWGAERKRALLEREARS